MTGKPPFDSAVTAHGATVWRVCRAVVGATEADDAWSETFLAALRAYPELPEDTNLEAWLVRIAQRKAVDLLRARRRRPLPTDELPEPISPVEPISSVEPDHDVVTALDGLSPRQRQAVAYHYLAGLPYAEVARVLGGSTDAARRAAADGIAALRRGGAFRRPSDHTTKGRA